MKAYIGTKIIQAMPMTKQQFGLEKNQPIEPGHTPGYKVLYPDGYTSWSPKSVFENAYREVTDGEYELLNNQSNP